MKKMYPGRFTIQFDPNNPSHAIAISVLNEKNRRKADYIAKLISDSENEEKNNESLRKTIKAALQEVLEENNFMLQKTQKDNEEEIILNGKGEKSDIPNTFSKEVLQGLSVFGIKRS